MDDSCIVLHFEHYCSLPASDKLLLVSLEKSATRHLKNTVIWNEGDYSRHFCTVKSGWVCSFRHLQDGRRQIVDVFMPGDVVGLREVAFRRRITGLITLTEAELCEFPKFRLSEVFAESSLLCNIFFLISARDQAILLERLANLGQRTARQAMAHFLVEMASRLKRIFRRQAPQVRLPFSQTFLGDVLGLSTVHINRTFRSLREEGLIRRNRDHIELLDMERLKRISGFNPAYLQPDLSSLPPPRGGHKTLH